MYYKKKKSVTQHLGSLKGPGQYTGTNGVGKAWELPGGSKSVGVGGTQDVDWHAGVVCRWTGLRDS